MNMMNETCQNHTQTKKKILIKLQSRRKYCNDRRKSCKIAEKCRKIVQNVAKS